MNNITKLGHKLSLILLVAAAAACSAGSFSFAERADAGEEIVIEEDATPDVKRNEAGDAGLVPDTQADAQATPDANAEETGDAGRSVDGEASCGTIRVVQAIYAASCGASTNLPSVAALCNGLEYCQYVINNAIDPGYDPAFGCYKDLTISFACGDRLLTVYDPEAWNGHSMVLDCCSD